MKKRIGYKAILCIGLILCMTATLVMTSASNASAEVATKPAFEVKINSVSPEFPKVGEDITVSGKIIPKDFEAEVPAKEIVLVLDVSGSMADNVYVNGKSSTKIAELKKAAKNFVDKMKDVPNLKIGIVAYSSNASIKKVDKEILIDANKVNELKTVIDNLKADGGTNTGEGLRKAAYLLSTSKEKNANKTVVLMSDGVPTFYSYYYSYYYKYFYKNIDDSNPKFDGKGNELDDDAVEYANIIGERIKESTNNVFSIGYGLGNRNSEANKTLKQIHESMGGKEGNFFASDNGAIDSVFQNIATEILASYAISNVKMDMNLKSGFSLKVGGNKVDIDNVLYKTDGKVKDGKVTYTADPVPFEFVIKSGVTGQHELFAGSTVSFPWKDNEIITAPVPSISVNIDKNELPNIKAKLTSPSEVEAYPGEEIKVTYDIKPENFVFQDSENESTSNEKEIVFLLDTSKNGGANYLDDSKHLWSGLLNDYNKKDSMAKFGLVTYSNTAEIESELTDAKDIKNELENVTSSSSTERNIGNALEMADSILTNGNKWATKYIIILAAGDVSYDINKINAVKNKGYSIISLKLGTSGSDDINNTKSLKWIHNELWGIEDDYFNAVRENGGALNNKVKEIALRLSTKRYKSYVFGDVKLNFNIGDEFDVVSGLKSVESSSSYNYALEIPEIRYTYDVVNKIYKASGSQVSFIIKTMEHGKLKFKDSNTITYTNLIGEMAKFNIETPTIIVRGQTDILHGIYNGYDSKTEKYNIDTVERTLAKEATVTFGATFETYSSKANIGLKVPSNAKIQDTPKVYKVDEEGNLQLLGDMVMNSTDSLYSYTLGGNVVKDDNIIVLYTITLPKDEGAYENIISVDGVEAPAKFNVGKEALPDLF
ncbi:VWA domain-containing protein [Clostridium sp. UBA7339]|uniref:VWA domain-containing protein n=1 Tax=Clostridium sp. UBA7339 TaxID=1946376 RepID=UPI0032167217